MNVIEYIISTIAPHYCIGCQMEGSVLCTVCIASLEQVPSRCYRCGCLSKNFQTCMRCRRSSALKNVWVTTAYGGLAKESIHALKFGRAQSTAADIAQAMAIQLPAGLLVTHVPTATDRVRKRGYDQAQLMSNGIARLLSSPAIPLLARTGQQRQLGRGGGTRRKQMEGAFRALRPRRIHQADILLIDDVLTTGATLEAAALTLKAAGARQVYGAVFAQA